METGKWTHSAILNQEDICNLLMLSEGKTISFNGGDAGYVSHTTSHKQAVYQEELYD